MSIMKSAAILPTIATLVLIMIVAICCAWKNSEQYPEFDHSAEESLRDQANIENTYVISYQQARRKGTYGQIDATDGHLFFSYSRSSCVDVFNHQGEFQYAIILPDCQNGTVQIRCVGNSLFVSDKKNVVCIFDENGKVERIDYDQAKLRGYDYFWFEEKRTNQMVDESHYYEMDAAGSVIRKVLLPTENTNINVLRIVIIVIAVLLYILSILSYFLKSIRTKS